jgi:TPR repeat protein
MFPAESEPTESYASNALTSPTTSDHRFAVIGLVVLLALAAAAGAAAYYYPSEVRGVISSVQAKVRRSINAHGQPTSTAEAAAMAGSPTRDPAFAGNLESVPRPPDGSTGSTAAPIPAPPPSTADTQPTPDATNSNAAPTSDAVLTKNNSQADVELAQTYLARGTTPDEKAKAVQLLWLATEKGNVDAELRLADLYARGDSVPKSCVQARILLKAAAVANPSAAQPKLVELDDSGCN